MLHDADLIAANCTRAELSSPNDSDCSSMLLLDWAIEMFGKPQAICRANRPELTLRHSWPIIVQSLFWHNPGFNYDNACKQSPMQSSIICMAIAPFMKLSAGHARSKLQEILVIHASPITTEAMAGIGALYAIKDEVRREPANIRLSVRQTRVRPLLDDMRKWMEKALRSLPAKNETAAAIRFAFSSWRALTRHFDDGIFGIYNSAAERALRAVAIPKGESPALPGWQ
jgi:hypothetical protein